jgi:phenylacetate-CoA ligase
VLLWGPERDIFENSIGIKAKLSNSVTHIGFLNSFRRKKDDMSRYIDKINSYKQDIVRDYGGSLFELCRQADDENIRLHSQRIVVSAAETLHDDMRDVIEASFGSSVYNFYGSREAPCVAAECEHGSCTFLDSCNISNYLMTTTVQ